MQAPPQRGLATRGLLLAEHGGGSRRTPAGQRRIINSIAPAAKLLSVRAVEPSGNLGGLVAALYIAQATFRPNIINMSLSLTCDPSVCGSCGNALGRSGATTFAQLQLLFSLIDVQLGGTPLLVGAAGNGCRNVRMPASFPGMLAVGSCTLPPLDSDVSSFSRYDSIDPERFILAPGGEKGPNQGFGHRDGLRRGKDFFGTSFSAAFVSGVAARYACAGLGGQCVGRSKPPNGADRRFLLGCLRDSAHTELAGYTPAKHGLGIARYRHRMVSQPSS